MRLHDLTTYHGRINCFDCLLDEPLGQAPVHYAGSLCGVPVPLINFEETQGMRIAFTDGEMSNLNADFGQLLCAGIAEYQDGKVPWKNVQIFTLQDYDGDRWRDGGLARKWRDALQKYDIVVTWNGIKFDIPFLNTRLQRWGSKEVMLGKHKDLMYTARFKMRLHSASLESVSSHLRINDKYGIAKTKMTPERWTMALGGHKPSYGYIIKHCVLDVKVLAAVWQEIKHLVTDIK